MKQTALFGIIAMLVGSTSAFAAGEATLTTKNYVDQGLIEVNNRIKTVKTTADNASTAASNAVATANAASDKVDDLAETIGDETDGLVKDVEDLKDTVGDANGGLVKRVTELEGKTAAEYTGGVGISVNSNNQIGLNGLTGAQDGKTYVFKDGAWVELPVVDTWDASILN